MRKIPLKSRFGCQKCKTRRRKCDEVRPICGECARLGFACRWTPSAQIPIEYTYTLPSSAVDVVGSTTSLVQHPSRALVDRRRNSLEAVTTDGRTFDSPSILRTDAVPDNGHVHCKHILQYLSEQGAIILNYPAERIPADRDVNVFRSGFGMAARASVQLEAYLCLGAGHLAKVHPSFEQIALKYYSSVMSRLRTELMSSTRTPPAEWTCAVAALLAFHELIVFESAESRLAHLTGFHCLVEVRLRLELPWAPLKVLLEQYIHSLTIGSLFHDKLLIGQKPISYIDKLLVELSSAARPLGREIAGVPEDLTAVVYRLAILNTHDITQSPWDTELVATKSKLVAWKPAPHTLLPSGAKLLLAAKLYQFACMCLLQVIEDRVFGALTQPVARHLRDASSLLEAVSPSLRPFNSLVWPLTVLSVFALDPRQRKIFTKPISHLIENAKIQGYSSILLFLSTVDREGIGADVFLRPDLLSLVHM